MHYTTSAHFLLVIYTFHLLQLLYLGGKEIKSSYEAFSIVIAIVTFISIVRISSIIMLNIINIYIYVTNTYMHIYIHLYIHIFIIYIYHLCFFNLFSIIVAGKEIKGSYGGFDWFTDRGIVLKDESNEPSEVWFVNLFVYVLSLFCVFFAFLCCFIFF